MNARIKYIAALVAVVVCAGIGAGVAVSHDEPAWKVALNKRSEALNERYLLNEPKTAALVKQAGRPEWLTALVARSEGLNRQYGLGDAAGAP